MTNPRSASEAAVVERYHELLSSSDYVALHEQLMTSSKQREISFGGKPVCDALRPRFLSIELHEQAQRGASLVSRALATLYSHGIRDATLRREMGISEWWEPFVNVDANIPVPNVVGRLDGLVDDAGNIQFIEYNASPGGLLYSDMIGEIFQEMPIMQDFSRYYEPWASRTSPSLIATLRSHGTKLGRSGGPGIVLVGPVPEKSQAEMSGILDYISKHGIRLKVAGEETHWVHKNNRLWADDFPADVLTFSLPSNAAGFALEKGLDHPALQAVASGSAVILNGLFRSLFLYSKLLFAALSDPAFEHLFGAELAASVRKYIPWTRIVREGKASYNGREIDLLPFISEHRDNLVLKPAHGFGGAEVSLGWTCTSEEWDRAIKHSLESSFLVQERVRQLREPYPLVRNGVLSFEQRYADLNPFLWNNDYVSGYFVRASSADMLNMSAGTGTLVPTFIVRERG